MNGVKDQSKSEAMDIDADKKTAEYTLLLEHGVPVKIAAKLDSIFKTGKLTIGDLDDRVFETLKDFPAEDAATVIDNFVISNLDHVSNKAAFLSSMLRAFRHRKKSPGPAIPPLVHRGPDEEKTKAILARTGYSLDVTTGQRKYGGPPPGWEGPEPSHGCEVFCGKIPKDVYEDELIPLFEKSGKIYDLRLMMDPLTGLNRGFAFVTFTTPEEAQQAVKDLDGYQIKPGKKLRVNITVPNVRLFIGNIPKSKGKEEIMTEFSNLTVGLVDAIVYAAPDEKKKNRGFCFLEYESHKAALVAKKKLGNRPVRVFNSEIIVDWADPQEAPADEVMSKVKVLYVRNLKSEFTEAGLKETFEAFGPVERIKKLKDYAFIHYQEREHAINAMNALNGKELFGSKIEISLAIPPSDKKKKEEILRNRERRMASFFGQRGIIPRRMLGGPRGMYPIGARMGHGYGDYFDEGMGYENGGARYGVGAQRYYGGGRDYGYNNGYSNGYYDEFGYEDDYYYDYPPNPPPRAGGSRMRGPARAGMYDFDTDYY